MDISESMRKFDELKYPLPKQCKAVDIKIIRSKIHVSQAVLAHILNIFKINERILPFRSSIVVRDILTNINRRDI